ncbi:hypothetical protein [Paenibacillus sp. 481]|uniref:hypothetical protein n=1 Tax=Paenibacillus sp. 481 TaxID=2835869 RepID=UPI001E574A68|nr:hypothetical protein [Paenibacillus sp. 481]UHA72045.1 hypothetical protein KIK04_15165 [Paenibacillus sp. 481]
MPFFIIAKTPVFLTWEKDKKLREEIYGLDNVFSSYIKISGKKDNEYKLFRTALTNKYNLNPLTFINEWSKFDLQNEDAQQNIWDLIYDYCAYYDCGYPSDLRDEVEYLQDDFQGVNFLFPQGKKFGLNHNVRPLRWWKYGKKKKGITIRTIIDSTKIKRVVGDLSEFVVEFDDHIMTCGKNFEVIYR